ncbi:hypothetical protein KI387_044007, partial [Taxus chinensis]
MDEGDGVDSNEEDGYDMGVTLYLGDVGKDGCGEGTTLNLISLEVKVDDGGIGDSLYWVGDGVERGLGLDLL